MTQLSIWYRPVLSVPITRKYICLPLLYEMLKQLWSSGSRSCHKVRQGNIDPSAMDRFSICFDSTTFDASRELHSGPSDSGSYPFSTAASQKTRAYLRECTGAISCSAFLSSSEGSGIRCRNSLGTVTCASSAPRPSGDNPVTAVWQGVSFCYLQHLSHTLQQPQARLRPACLRCFAAAPLTFGPPCPVGRAACQPGLLH